MTKEPKREHVCPTCQKACRNLHALRMHAFHKHDQIVPKGARPASAPAAPPARRAADEPTEPARKPWFDL